MHESVSPRAGRIIAALLLAAGLLPAQQRQLKPGFNLFSKDQDIQLGKEAATQVEKQFKILENAELQAYVNRIGQKLASQPGAENYPYTFKVVQDPSINAFALPGGPTFVHTGLIMAAENEGQLAGVMAHEISHVALRHGTNQASRANLIALPAMLAGAMTGNSSILGSLAQLGIGIGANSVLMKYSRNAERDADLLGARLMSAAGYNPLEMARFFEKLEAETGNRNALAQFLSSHPNPGNRVKEVEKEILYFPKKEYTAASADLGRMKKIIEKLPAAKGVAPQSQASPAEARPSGRFAEFRGREFSMSHPDNWKVSGDSNTFGIVAAAPAGLVQSGGQSSPHIAYGALTGFQEISGTVNLQSSTSEMIKKFQADNQGMEVSGGTRRMRVDNSDALLTTLVSQSAYANEREIDVLLTVQRPGGVFYLIFVTPESEFNANQAVLQQMMRSIRFR